MQINIDAWLFHSYQWKLLFWFARSDSEKQRLPHDDWSCGLLRTDVKYCYFLEGKKEPRRLFFFIFTCDLGAGILGHFVQLVTHLCGITWPSYCTALCLIFPMGGTEMIILYKNHRNFGSNEFVRNALICVWARLLLMSVGLQIRPHNCQVFLFFCKAEPALLLKG